MIYGAKVAICSQVNRIHTHTVWQWAAIAQSVSTRYGQDDPEIESLWVRDFPPGAHPASYTMVTGSFSEVK
jgi:hypothetical protein